MFPDDAETFVHQEFNEEGLRIRPTAENLLTTMMQYNRQVEQHETEHCVEQEIESYVCNALSCPALSVVP
eukprot:766935-Hanusia_phi.AAC.2